MPAPRRSTSPSSIPHALPHDVFVTYSTVEGTATGSKPATATTPAVVGDFVSVTGGTLMIPKGQTSRNIEITINGDTLAGIDEAFTVKLDSAVGAKLGATPAEKTATGTITNDDGPLPTISLVGGTGAENGTTGKITFTALLSAANDSEVKVNYTTIAGTALAEDFAGVATTAQLTIAPGAGGGPIDIAVVDDELSELAETFKLKLLNVVDGTGAQAISPTAQPEATGTIAASDLRNLSFVSQIVRANEGNATGPQSEAVFTFKLDVPTKNALTFRVFTESGTAVEGVDFEDYTQEVTIPADSDTATVRVKLTGDDMDEVDETFKLNVELRDDEAVPTPVILLPGQNVATGVIANDESTYTITRVGGADSAVTVTEGTDGFARFTVTRSDTTFAGSVHYQAIAGTASATDKIDFRALSGDVTFAPGIATATIAIPILDDDRYEGPAATASETFTVKLSAPVNGVLSAVESENTGTVSIKDNDAAPVLKITNATPVLEGNFGQKNMVFTVTLSRPNEFNAVTVNFTTADGTAKEGPGFADYEKQTGTITFAKGDVSETITIKVNGDDRFDSATNETLKVLLSLASGDATLEGAVAGQITGTGTIVNDDPAPVVRISNATAVEGDNIGFVVSLSRAADLPVEVKYYTVNGTALDGADFTGKIKVLPGVITIPAGETSKQIVLATLADPGQSGPIDEPTESFQVKLLSGGLATVSTKESTATGTILDDDHAVLAISDVTIQEGDNGTAEAVFQVTLTNQASQPISFQYRTVDGSATAGLDYVSRTGTFIMPANTLTDVIRIPVTGDLLEEFDASGARQETFTLELFNAKNAALGDASATAAILDDDDTPTLNIVNVRQREGNPTNNTPVQAGDFMEFMPTLTSIADTDVTFSIFTANPTNLSRGVAVGGAAGVAGADYVSASIETVTIVKGQLTPAQPFRVQVNRDFAFENSESFAVRLGNVTGAQAGQTTALGTILNDDFYLTARTAKWIDVDGELVTVTASKGNLFKAGFLFKAVSQADNNIAINELGGRELTQLNLASAGQSFLRANISITSSPQPGFDAKGIVQDGLVNIGTIRSNDLTNLTDTLDIVGVDLGVVTVEGDLTSIVVGDNFNDAALQQLSVKSFGVKDPGQVSISASGIGFLNIAGDMRGNLFVKGAQFANIGRLNIGGILRGGDGGGDSTIGSINLTGTLGSSVIGGIVGGGVASGLETADTINDNAGSGSITAGNITKVVVKGSILGGTASSTGSIVSSKNIGSVSVGGSVEAGAGPGSGVIFANSLIGALRIDGDLSNEDRVAHGFLTNTQTGLQEDLADSGRVTAGRIGKVDIGGSIIQARIQAVQSIAALTVGHDLLGSVNRPVYVTAAGIQANLALPSVIVGGQATHANLLAGHNLSLEPVNGDASIGLVRIDGNVNDLDIVAGISPGTAATKIFGEPIGTNFSINDSNIPTTSVAVNQPSIIARIATVIIGGTVTPSGTFNAITAQQVDTVIVNGQPLPLTGGIDRVEVVAGTGFRVAEIL